MEDAMVSIFDRILFVENMNETSYFTGDIVIVEVGENIFYFQLICGEYIKTSDESYNHVSKDLPSVRLIDKELSDAWIKNLLPTYRLSWPVMVHPFTTPYVGSVWSIMKVLIDKNKSSS